MPIVEQDYTNGLQKLRKNEGLSVTEAKELIAMGEAPHEIYTDVERKARAEKVCGNCKFWQNPIRPWADNTGRCTNSAAWNQAEINLTTYYFGCIHFEPK